MLKRRESLDGERGLALIEMVAAVSMLAIAFVSLAAAMGSGFRQVALGRQRQSATELGNGRIEHLRNVPYANLALSSDVVHNTDPGHPDYFVNDATNSFDYSGNGTFEPLIEDTVGGQIQHLESPVVVGATTLTVYQYVTWVDDPDIAGTQDYRRVTIVIRSNQPVAGVERLVRVSSFFTTGAVTLGGTGVGVGTGSPTPSPTATPTPTPTTGPCTGDTTPPVGEFDILAGTVAEQGFTASPTVTLRLTGVSDPCTPIAWMFSNDDVTWSAEIVYDALAPSVAWSIPGGDGSKTIYAKVRDGVGNSRSPASRSITLDTTKPTVPGTLSRTVACSGNDRTVNLAWGASTDTNFRGYRIYKSINNAPWIELGTVSTTSKSDTDNKTYDSLRYYVVGYDKAGNESNATNTVSLAKNQCS